MTLDLGLLGDTSAWTVDCKYFWKVITKYAPYLKSPLKVIKDNTPDLGVTFDLFMHVTAKDDVKCHGGGLAQGYVLAVVQENTVP